LRTAEQNVENDPEVCWTLDALNGADARNADASDPKLLFEAARLISRCSQDTTSRFP